MRIIYAMSLFSSIILSTIFTVKSHLTCDKEVKIIYNDFIIESTTLMNELAGENGHTLETFKNYETTSFETMNKILANRENICIDIMKECQLYEVPTNAKLTKTVSLLQGADDRNTLILDVLPSVEMTSVLNDIRYFLPVTTGLECCVTITTDSSNKTVYFAISTVQKENVYPLFIFKPINQNQDQLEHVKYYLTNEIYPTDNGHVDEYVEMFLANLNVDDVNSSTL